MNDKQYEILALTLRYWFVLLIIYVFAKSAARTLQDLFSEKPVNRSTGNIPFVLVLFTLTSFGLLAMQDSQNFNIDTVLMGLLVSAIVLFQFYLLYYLFPGMDEILLLMVNTLAILGFVMLQRLTPELALRQVEWFTAGSVILFVVMLIMPRFKSLGKMIYPLMALGAVTLFLVAFFGEESGGATSRLPVGSILVQPMELVKVIFILALANTLSEEKTFREKIPLFLFVAACILGIVLQKDLGSALHYFIVFLFVYQISTNDWLITMAAAGAGALASIIGYKIFSHVRVRVEAWKNPWADIGGKGWQVAQSLIAMGSGGLVGLGLGLGSPNIIPASRTDFIFAAICEEFGILVGGMVIGFFALILIRSMHKATLAQFSNDMLLACGSSVSLAVQAFIIIGGVVKMIPLTGVTLPFISYGGSSMVASFALLGLIQSVCIRNYRFAREMEGHESNHDEYNEDDMDEEAKENES
ncbi:MAG: FtsW/RodA/SpoVE family cell cycle protein [Caldicoprobacterales bacterium]|nr:FtsW/RodA/SpoVE family cell cycle protein [Clostridiales bacterium]